MLVLPSLVILGAIHLSTAAPDTTPAVANSTVPPPQCGSHCMSIKLTEAANWFGPGDLTTFCTFPQFLTAFNRCVDDHCHGENVTLSKQAGVYACANVRQAPSETANHTSTPTNSTGAPAVGGAGGNRTGMPADLPVGTTTVGANATSGNLNSTLSTNASATTNGHSPAPAPTSRFSSAVSNASQAAAASSASSLMSTEPSHCLIAVSTALLLSLAIGLGA